MEFIYKLLLVDRLFIEKNWTEEDEIIVEEHFNHLQNLLKNGKLIMAGKTNGLSLDTYGIVVFKAETKQEAKSIMKNDPAITKGIMTGHLQEFNTALFNNEYKK